MIGAYTDWFTTVVTVTVSLGWRFASQILIRQSPVRFVLSVATTLVREGFKVKVDTWINKQKRSKRSKFFSSMKLTFKNTISWAKKKRRITSQSDEVQDIVALDAGMKYKELAKRRLDAARTSFEAAAVELRAAERGMKDAERYVKSLRLHCKQMGKPNNVRCNCISDVVFVEHAKQNEGDKIQQSGDNAPVSTD